MTGIQGADYESQLAYARAIMAGAPPAAEIYRKACHANGAGGFGPIESEFLFAYIFRQKPKRILQVGAGVATSVIRQGAAAAGYMPHIVCIDPFPTEYLRRCAANGEIELRDVPVESLPCETARVLEVGDLFFIDSTHTLGPAGEVTRLVVEWLPVLNPGVQVHFHDIYFPYDYSNSVLGGGGGSELFFWHETALLMAFLTMNPGFRILCCQSMLHHMCPKELQALFPSHQLQKNEDGVGLDDGAFAASLYLERLG